MPQLWTGTTDDLLQQEVADEPDAVALSPAPLDDGPHRSAQASELVQVTPEDAGAYFIAHRGAIEAAARQGDTKANNIITLRKMFYASPNDPGALGLLCAAISEYSKEHK